MYRLIPGRIYDLYNFPQIATPFLVYCIDTDTRAYILPAGPRSAVGRAPDSQVRGPGFDTRSGNILSFLLPLFQEGQLSVVAKVCVRSTGFPLRRSKPAQEKCG